MHHSASRRISPFPDVCIALCEYLYRYSTIYAKSLQATQTSRELAPGMAARLHPGFRPAGDELPMLQSGFATAGHGRPDANEKQTRRKEE
jgi:hypothetical protein